MVESCAGRDNGILTGAKFSVGSVRWNDGDINIREDGCCGAKNASIERLKGNTARATDRQTLPRKICRQHITVVLKQRTFVMAYK